MSDKKVKYLAGIYGIPIATYDKHFKKYRHVILLKRDTPIKDTLEYLGYA